MKQTLHYLAIFILLCSMALSLASQPAWKPVRIEVEADQPINTQYSLQAQPDGFERLDITLTNQGDKPLTIQKITIQISLEKPLTDDLDIIYGGSCMGRTPLLRQKIAAANPQSTSTMYQMVRLQNGQYLFAGSLSWRIFMPNFTVKDGGFEISSLGEGKQLKPGQSIQFEKIALRLADDWVTLLQQFGTAIAAENGIAQLKPANFKGWATWDYYAYKFSNADIDGNIAQLKNLDPSSNLIQIDAGWYTTRGDYTQVRPDLLGGMKDLASKVKEQGMIPGIWIDGFRANSFSEVCKKHPEYFLHDQDGKMIIEVRRPEGPDRDRVYFDYSHPGARAHIAECIRVLKQEWGYPYFKIDFMRFGLNQEIMFNKPNLKKIIAHDPTITDVERMRLGLQTMRDALGPDTYLLGCSAVFGPCIGFVDGMRTGADINPRFEAFPERSLGNLGHFYLAGKVFNGDADYLTFREAADEDEKVSKEEVKHGGTMTLNEAQMWADLNKLYGTARIQGDNLLTLRPERKSLVKQVFDFPIMDDSIPLDLWQKATNKTDGFEKILARKDNDIYLGLFNWTDAPKDYSLPAFGKSEPIKLQGRHSTILKYDGQESFTELRKKLQSR